MATAQKTKAAKPAASPRLVTAFLRNCRMSPRKMRVVAQTVVRQPAASAIDRLKMLRKAPAVPLAKLIASAVANASHNFQIAKEDLVVREILVNQGPTLKRWRPRAFGRAGMIRKRPSHITVILAERPGAARKPATAAAKPAEPIKTVTLDELKRGMGDAAGEAGKDGKPGESGRSGGKGFTRKLFNRKAG